MVLVAAALALWWLRGRRVEVPVAPPAITTGDRVLAEPSPGQRDVQGDDAEEITPPEKQELDRVLRDDAFRALLAKNALEHSSQFTWTATARGTLEVLAAEALRRKTR